MRLICFLVILFSQISCFAQNANELFQILNGEQKSYNGRHFVFDIKEVNYQNKKNREAVIADMEKTIASLSEADPRRKALSNMLKDRKGAPLVENNRITVVADIINTFKWHIDYFSNDDPNPFYTYIGDGSGIAYCIITRLHRVDIRKDASSVLNESLRGVPIFSINNDRIFSKEKEKEANIQTSDDKIYLKINRNQDQDLSASVILDKKTLQCIGFEWPYWKVKTISKGETTVDVPNPDFDKNLEQTQNWKLVKAAPIQDIRESLFHYKFEPGYTVNVCKSDGSVEKIDSAKLIDKTFNFEP